MNEQHKLHNAINGFERFAINQDREIKRLGNEAHKIEVTE